MDAPPVRQRPHLSLLGIVEVEDRIVPGRPGLDLDSNEFMVQSHDEINFAAPNTEVVFDEIGAAVLEEPGGYRFA